MATASHSDEVEVEVHAEDEDCNLFHWDTSIEANQPLWPMRRRWAQAHFIPENAVGFEECGWQIDLQKTPLQLGWTKTMLTQKVQLWATPTDEAHAENLAHDDDDDAQSASAAAKGRRRRPDDDDDDAQSASQAAKRRRRRPDSDDDDDDAQSASAVAERRERFCIHLPQRSQDRSSSSSFDPAAFLRLGSLGEDPGPSCDWAAFLASWERTPPAERVALEDLDLANAAKRVEEDAEDDAAALEWEWRWLDQEAIYDMDEERLCHDAAERVATIAEILIDDDDDNNVATIAEILVDEDDDDNDVPSTTTYRTTTTTGTTTTTITTIVQVVGGAVADTLADTLVDEEDDDNADE